ncbi:MAG: ABC transporter substrate-binding protein [bacterium]|nr:ABC transporter substrate-binding protein [bacterium]
MKFLKVFLIISLILSMLAISVPVTAQEYPVPRNQAYVYETDTKYTVFDKANTFVPRGTQWGSGWHQVANEWDWYINYATGETIYWRITGWKYSRDRLELRWFVRKGVTWNDGTPYTAHDIVFTIETLMKNPDLLGTVHVANVKSVSAIDDYTVSIKFKTPEYRFHHKLRMWGGITVVAKHKWEGKDPRDYANWPPVETGPYKFHSYNKDLNLFIWERDENYWAKKVFGVSPGPKYVICRMAPPPDIDLADFIRGGVDGPLPHIFTWEMIKAAQRRTENVVLSPYMDAVSQGFTYNCAKYPTSLRDFRWAIQYLANRELLAKTYPMAEKSYPTMWPWPDWKALDKWEFPDIQKKYGEMMRYDPKKAETILDRLGFKKGPDGKRRTPKGEPLSLVLLTRPAPDLGYVHAKHLSDELAKIGIEGIIKVVDQAMFGELVNTGNYDIAFDVLDVAVAFPNDIYPFLDSYHSRHAKPIGEYQTSGDRMRSKLRSKDLDKITETLATMDPDSSKYMLYAKRGLDIWFRELPSVPLVEKMFVQVFSDKYWKGWPTEGNMYHVPYQWWPSFIFILFKLKPAS